MQIEQNSAAGPLIAAPTSGRHWTLSRALAVTCLLVGLVAGTEAVAVPAQIGVDVHATPARLLPGATAHYVVEVRNSGGMQAGARLGVAIPEGLQNAAWTCVAHAGSRCSAATASGNLNQSLDGLAAGSALEFHLDARVSSAPPAFVDLQASTSLPTGARCADGQTAPCRARASLPAGAGVVLDLSSSATALLAGQVVQYSITARTDTVHASTAGSVLRSPVPNGLINSHWTCQSSAGACAQAQGTGSIEQVLGNFSGSELRFDITAEVAANPPVTIVQLAALAPPFGAACVGGGSRNLDSAGGVCVARNALATTPWIFASRSPDYSVDGATVSNRFVLENHGTTAASTTISLPLPEQASGIRWTCQGSGMSCPQSSGTGPVSVSVPSWPGEARLVYDVVTRFDGAESVRGESRMTVMAPASARCGNAETRPPCVAIHALAPDQGNLDLQLGVDRLGAKPGQDVIYTVEVGNATNAPVAENLVLSVALPKGIETFSSWSCSASGAVCPYANGSGAIRQVLTQLGPDARMTFKIVARVSSDAPDLVSASAVLAPPVGANLGCRLTSGRNAACVSTAEFSTTPVFALGQSAAGGDAATGGSVNYSMDVFNMGAGSGQVSIRNMLPLGLSGAHWTCTGLGMVCPEQAGNDGIATGSTRMPSGAGLRFDVSGESDVISGSVIDSVLEAIPSARGRCHPDLAAAPNLQTCTDQRETSAQPLLDLNLRGLQPQLLVGGTADWIVTVGNQGGEAQSTGLSIPLPTGIARLDWTCDGFGGAVCPLAQGAGAIATQIGRIPSGGALAYRLRAVLAQSTLDRIEWVAELVPPADGHCIADSCVRASTTPVRSMPAAHLELSMLSGTEPVQAGGTSTWTLDVRNLGSEMARNVAIATGPADSGVSVLSWTCTGLECPAPSGSGPIGHTVRSLAAFNSESDIADSDQPGRLVYSIVGRVDSAARPEVALSATARPSDSDSCSSVDCRIDAAVSEAPAGLSPEVTLTLTADTTQATLGGTVQFTYRLESTGGTPVSSLQASGFAQAGIDSMSWTCVATGGASCTPSGVGDINDFPTTFFPGATLTYTITADVTDATQYPFVEYSGFVVGSLGQINTPNGPSIPCVPASCSVNISVPLTLPPAAMRVTKTANKTSLIPGDSVRYTVTFENTGGDFDSVANNLQFGDPIPNGLESFSWTCTGVGFKAFCPQQSGTGPIADSISFLSPGEAIVYTIDAVVSANASGSVLNRAFMTGDSISCTPVSCQAVLNLPVEGQIPTTVEITKLASPASGIPVVPGQAISWTLRASNAGAATSAPVVLTDNLPANVENLIVQPAGGVQCSSLNPAPGEQLVCTIPQGFSGERLVVISATVPGSAISAISNSVSASGADQPTCVSCSVSNPIALPVDVSVANPRAFSAGGIQGTLVDIVNLSAVSAGNISVTISPAASLQLLAPLSTGCTATQGAGGSVSVSCPNPPSSQGIQCSGNSCSLAQIPSGAAVSLFVALNPNSNATLEAPVAGDVNPANNSINLTAGGTP